MKEQTIKAVDLTETTTKKRKRKRPWRARVRREAKKARLAEEQHLKPILNDSPHENTTTKKKRKRRKKKNVTMKELRKDETVEQDDGLSEPQKRLEGARFRFLNEQLFTTSSKEARKLFEEDENAYKAYHKGFQLQVKKWPLNPIDVVILDLNGLPKGTVVADVGCGDAKIFKRMGERFQVHSFDLVASNEHVVAADMAQLPLDNESVDVAVYCLSLMGTNLADFLREAHRILKMGGKLKIVEICSRIRNFRAFVNAIQKMGFCITRKKDLQKFFVFITFEKVGEIEMKKPKGLILKPCLYKKR